MRVVLEDGTWGLVRASSNKPSLVVVVESPANEANMRAMFQDIDARLAKHPEVGEYDQKILTCKTRGIAGFFQAAHPQSCVPAAPLIS
jgi:hypothetical protein